MFENEFDFNEINDNEFFEKLSSKEQGKTSSEKLSDSADKEECKTPANVDAESEDQISSVNNTPVKVMQEDNYLSNAIVRMKDHKTKCTKLHAK